MKKGLLILAAMITISIGAIAQKYGHVDAQVLLTELPTYKKAEDSLKIFAKKLEAEMESQFKVYQQRVKDFEEGKAAGIFTPSIDQSRMEELQGMQHKMQAFQQGAQTDIQNMESALLEPLIKQIKDSIDKVATENKYAYIFDSNILLFHGGGDDIGPLVKKDLGIVTPTAP